MFTVTFQPSLRQEGAHTPALAALLLGSHSSGLLNFKLVGRTGIISNEAYVLKRAIKTHWAVIYVLPFCAW